MVVVLKRFGKYVTVGLLAASSYWGMLYILTEYVHIWYMISAVVSTVVTSPLAFALHSLWTWKKNTIGGSITNKVVRHWHNPMLLMKSQLAKYYIVGAGGVLLEWVMLFIYTDFVGVWYMVSAFIAAVIVWVITFILRDRWIMGKQ